LRPSACSSIPDPTSAELLYDGYWHGSLGPYDFVYELMPNEQGIGGASHMIRDGKQLTLVPIVGGSLAGKKVELRFRGVPSYLGRIDLQAGRITGGHPGAPAYAELNLTKVAKADWPMVPPKPIPPAGEPAYVWTRPADLGDGWQTEKPSEVGIDPEAVDSTVNAILSGVAGTVHSFLVVRDGRLVVEEYFHGWKADDLHRIASCTKSISSLLVGIAIDQGRIAGVEVPLLDFFPEQRAAAGKGWDAIRLEHVLSMAMGLDWTAAEAEEFPAPGENRFAEVIRRNVKTNPGTSWRYVSRDVNLLSAVILHATGTHADLFAAERLFEPLGIASWDWEKNKYEGHPSMSGTLKLRPRDMAKIGQLVLDEGSWQGRRIVSSGWIHESTRDHFNPSGNDEYGYLWWGLDEPAVGGVDYAMGIGSQFIAIAPALRLVVVITGGNNYNDKQTAIMTVTNQHLMPGIH
jgi:CubicO group peptidase (beta-lactamase class C family)